jgi:hypothetical protein
MHSMKDPGDGLFTCPLQIDAGGNQAAIFLVRA